MLSPELFLELHNRDVAERERRHVWKPSQPKHPPGWRLALARWLRFAADRLVEPRQSASRAQRASG